MKTSGCLRGSELGLDGAVHAVAGVTESGDDVALLVEMIVEGGGVDGNVWVIFVETGDAFGSGDEADHPDIFGAGIFDHGDGG